MLPEYIFQSKGSLMTNNHIHIITELRVPCVHSTGSILITTKKVRKNTTVERYKIEHQYGKPEGIDR